MSIKLDLKLDPELLNETAKEWAQKLERGTKKTQLRNFYDKVLQLQAETKKKDFSEIYPFIKMLNSKVAYARNRRVVNEEFVTMMSTCLNQIGNDESGKRKFDTFQLFFEAILGFFKGRD